MSNLTEIEIIKSSIYAGMYQTPMAYALTDYTATTTEVTKGNFVPKWVTALNGVIDDIDSLPYESSYNLIMGSTTGEWGFLTLSTMGITTHFSSMLNLYIFTKSVAETIDETSTRGTDILNCVRFMEDVIFARVPNLSGRTIMERMVTPVNQPDFRFPTFDTANGYTSYTTVMERIDLYKTARDTDNVGGVEANLSQQNVNHSSMIIRGLLNNRNMPPRVSDRVGVIVRKGRVDFNSISGINEYKKAMNGLNVSIGLRVDVMA